MDLIQSYFELVITTASKKVQSTVKPMHLKLQYLPGFSYLPSLVIVIVIDSIQVKKELTIHELQNLAVIHVITKEFAMDLDCSLHHTISKFVSSQ